MTSLYIHVPFCKKRCHYCSFYSTTCGKEERELYVAALQQELIARSSDDLISSVYFGGGTPSQLDAQELEDIFQTIQSYYHLSKSAEITFECNPDDIDAIKLSMLHSLGVNRISMGVQSFDDDILRSINRLHTSSQAIDAVDACIHADIHNVSVDLIYGFPGQTLELWEKDIMCAATLPVSHISSYALSIEKGTHIYNMRAQGMFVEKSEEEMLEMYEILMDCLNSYGFEHYEISNFSRPGRASVHNSNYWNGTPYIGVGPAAHSYDGINRRRWNIADLKTYISSPLDSYEEEILTSSELYDELIMTRLRTKKGLPLSLLTQQQSAYILRQGQKYLDSDMLTIADEAGNGISSCLRLTRKGLFVSDSIISDLMWDI